MQSKEIADKQLEKILRKAEAKGVKPKPIVRSQKLSGSLLYVVGQPPGEQMETPCESIHASLAFQSWPEL